MSVVIKCYQGLIKQHGPITGHRGGPRIKCYKSYLKVSLVHVIISDSDTSSAALYFCATGPLSRAVNVCLPVCLSVCLSVRLHACLSARMWTDEAQLLRYCTWLPLTT